MAIELTNDGTMDTVLRCSECGQEMRYNYDPYDYGDDVLENEKANQQAYDDFVDWAIEDATAEHECGL